VLVSMCSSSIRVECAFASWSSHKCSLETLMSLGLRAPARSCGHAKSMQHMKPILSQAGRLFGRRWSTLTQAPHHAALNTGLGSISIAWPSNKTNTEPPYPWQAVAAASIATASPQQTLPARDAKRVKQTVDYTTLTALCEELRQTWIPAKVEEVVQPDKYTLALRLRTLDEQGWLHLSWHPTAARVCMGQQPQRGAASEAFSFAEQGNVQLRGLVLTDVSMPQPWERVVQLSFGTRPGEPPSRRAYVEVMSRWGQTGAGMHAGMHQELYCMHQRLAHLPAPWLLLTRWQRAAAASCSHACVRHDVRPHCIAG
jgi:hypothetical protein